MKDESDPIDENPIKFEPTPSYHQQRIKDFFDPKNPPYFDNHGIIYIDRTGTVLYLKDELPNNDDFNWQFRGVVLPCDAFILGIVEHSSFYSQNSMTPKEVYIHSRGFINIDEKFIAQSDYRKKDSIFVWGY